MTHSIETLSGNRWPDPEPDATSLVHRVTEARRVPIGALTAEHLRILLGQQIDPTIVIPLSVA